MVTPPVCLLNIDLGELPDEPEALYRSAQLANIACGGHAGDARSMARALERCRAHGVQAGAHPSYPDKEGFGRRPMALEPHAVERLVREQCLGLSELARRLSVPLRHMKPHGALYGAADRDPDLARAVVAGSVAALGEGVAIVGRPGGGLEAEASARGLPFLKEGFADRGYLPDGRLLPRGEPGALIEEPDAVAKGTASLAASGRFDTLCVHGDGPNAVACAAAARSALDRMSHGASSRNVDDGWTPLGEGAYRLALPTDAGPPEAVWDALRRVPGVGEALVAGRWAAVYFDPRSPPDPAALSAALRSAKHGRARDAREHVLVVRYDGEDLPEVARATGLSPAQVAQLHASMSYEVEVVGFLPGFGYLGPLPPALRLPRRPSPRTRVPAGALAVAGSHTAIYPFASPGGWHLIGSLVGTSLFDPEEGALFAAGDRVRFVPESPGVSPGASARVRARGPQGGAGLREVSAIEVVSVKGAATLQDGGRPGRRAEGVPVGGALHPGLLAASNAAVGNPADAVGVESFGALTVRAGPSSLDLAVDGAPFPLEANDERELSPGEGRSVLYLAVRGGFVVPTVLGGRGTLSVAGLGGLEGRALRKGDRLPVAAAGGAGGPGVGGVAGAAGARRAPGGGTPSGISRPLGLDPEGSGDSMEAAGPGASELRIRFVPGPDASRFRPEALAVLTGGSFTLDGVAGRTGLRLSGPRVPRADGDEAAPAPMVPGAIQVPSSGAPIVLGPDGPTTGGYPVVGVVVREDLGPLLSLRAGARIRFRAVTAEEARATLRD